MGSVESLGKRVDGLEGESELPLLVRLPDGEIREFSAEDVRAALRDAVKGNDTPALVAWSEATAINDNGSGLVLHVNMIMRIYEAAKTYRNKEEAEDAQTES